MFQVLLYYQLFVITIDDSWYCIDELSSCIGDTVTTEIEKLCQVVDVCVRFSRVVFFLRIMESIIESNSVSTLVYNYS